MHTCGAPRLLLPTLTARVSAHSFRDPGSPAWPERFLKLESLVITVLPFFGVELLPTRSLLTEEATWLANSLPASLVIPRMRVSFSNLVNINMLSNALVNKMQELWLAETVIASPHEKCSAQAGLPGFLELCAKTVACEDVATHWHARRNGLWQ